MTLQPSPQAGSIIPARPMAHLHQHTQYSMLDGAARIESLIGWVAQQASESGDSAPACAITDHGNMHGAVHFWKAAHKKGVKPILGCEFYTVAGPLSDTTQKTYHLTLLAMNMTGYRNLCRLNHLAHVYGFHKQPRVTREWLSTYSEGIIALSGCVGAEVPQLLINGRYEEAMRVSEWFASVYKGRYFLEMQRHTHQCDAQAGDHSAGQLGYIQNVTLNGLQELAQTLGLGRVATNDGHYVRPEDATSHEVLLAMQTKAKMSDENRFRFPCDGFHVKSAAELQELLPANTYGEELYDNTHLIASMCEADYLPVGSKRVYQLPQTSTEAGQNEFEAMVQEVFAGLIGRYPVLDEDTLWLERARTAYAELSVTQKQELRRNGIVPQAGATRTQLWRLLAGILNLHVQEAVSSQRRIPHISGQRDEHESLAPHHPQRLINRALYECVVIGKMEFPGYFRIVADYISWSKKQKIVVGPGRGSGAGSIVAYALSITDLDPIEHGLLFERFLNPDRISMPDFDVDFEDRRREEVARYIQSRYGAERVAKIATFQSLSSRSVIKDVARTMGLDYSISDSITKLIPVEQGKATPLREARKLEAIQEQMRLHPQLNRIWEIAEQLEGLTKSPSTHAAGLVIGREPLDMLVPLMRDTSGEAKEIRKAKEAGLIPADELPEMLAAQFDMKSVEEIGLVKMDLLGLRTLSLTAETQRLIDLRRSQMRQLYPDQAAAEDARHNQITGKPFDLNRIPMDNEQTFKLLERGETAAVFQLEGSGITAKTREMKPRTLQDIIALGALYRPGPMDNIPTYIRRMHGLEQVTYDFPNCTAQLKPILDVTYGIPVYQEQIMQIASDVAGYTLGQADLLRRAMGKKDAEEMKRQRTIFVEKSSERGVPETEGNRLFDLLDRFASYGFNRSHAAAYGLISYWTAYLKANFPHEFWAAVMTTEQKDLTKLASYVAQARASGLEIMPPSVMESELAFRPEYHQRTLEPTGRIYFGLAAINQVSEDAANQLIKHREQHLRQDREGVPAFDTLMDVIRALGPYGKIDVLTNLIYAGALDDVSADSQITDGTQDIRAQLITSLPGQIEHLRSTTRQLKKHKEKGGRQVAMFNMDESHEEQLRQVPMAHAPQLETEEERAAHRKQQLINEFSALRIYLTGHPVMTDPSVYRLSTITSRDMTLDEETGQTRASARPSIKNRRDLITVQVEEVKQQNSKIGMMARVKASDEDGTMSVIFFPDAWKHNRRLVTEGATLAILGSPGREPGEFIANVVASSEDLRLASERRQATILIRYSEAAREERRRIQEAVTSHPGQWRVMFVEERSGQPQKATALTSRIGPEAIAALEALGGEMNITVTLTGREEVAERLRSMEPARQFRR